MRSKHVFELLLLCENLMNWIVRKFYSLPGIWQLWSLTVLSSVFTSKDLRARAKAGESKLPRNLYWTLAVVELGALAVWYAYYFLGKFESVGSLIAGGVFLVSGLVLIVTCLIYSKRRKPEFRAFLIEQGFAVERPELLTTAEL